jgi:hypothetical protein
MEETTDGVVDKDVPMKASKASQAYKDFLSFLELGCGGSPVQAYPAVMIVLSTIPPSVRQFL